MDAYLALADLSTSINLMPLSVWNKLSLPELSPTCMTLELVDHLISRPVGVAEDVFVKLGKFHFPADYVVVDFDADPREVDAFLALDDDPTSPEVDHSYYDTEGEILLLEAFLNDDPSLPPPTQGMYLPQIRKELKICEAKNDKSLIDEPLEVELNDLPPHLEYVFLEGNDKLPIIIAKYLSVEEKAALIIVLKSHKQAIAWKLFDIKGINPEFCTHKILMEDDFKPVSLGKPRTLRTKNGGFTVVENKENELIPTRLVTGWHVCIDYHKLNEATRKDHFPLPFRDQMLKRLARNEYYCFLDGFSGYFQIPIDLKDQEKTTFTCPYGTFAYRRMPFGLCNAPGTFQRRKVISWSRRALSYHKISKNGIEVDKAKVDVISKLPYPTTVKGVRSFLEKLTEAPILISPDWDLPFEFMCDANDFAIGAVLGQRHEKHFRPIHYASKTMTEAESHYTMTEKEMLVVVYAFTKFRSYLILNKSIVYTDHSALKYLFAKKIPRRDYSDGFSSFKSLNSKELCCERDVVPAKEQSLQICETLLLGRPILVQNMCGSSHPA
nr:hypothetical protein [Tanacetum cinerariifolium]